MSHTSRQRGMLVLAGILTTSIFLLDVALPLGVTVGTLYIFVILLGLWIREDWYPPAATIVAIVLLGIDTAINWTEVPPATIFFNRPLMTMVFVVTGLFVRRHSRVEQEAESRLKQLREQTALARLGQMAAVVAHEVRNPLAGIKGAMQVLAARRPEGDPESAVMTDIVARVDSLNDLLDDLLVFARPVAPRFEQVDLAALLQHAIDLVQSDPVGVHVDMRLESAPIEIEADPALLQALFLNLLINSAQATQGQGRIDIRARVDGRHAIVSLRDFGPGIPDDVATQMFEPFFTTKARGGGLGLPIARRTAELHEGSLTHVRPEGDGAEMVVTFALKPLNAPEKS